jgi:phage terminase large subunit-like protein
MKHGDQRPDTLLLDDIEPDESSYSMYKMEQRLRTLQDAVLPLAEMARVVLSGTVTMPGSITHQLIKHAKGYRAPDLEWVELEKIQVHHALPILTDDDGTERSFWPGNPVFTLEAMLPIRHTRQFMKNYLNDPMAVDAEYWSPEDFQYTRFGCTNTMISIDGAVTTGKRSDYTGIAVVGYAPPEKSDALNHSPRIGKCLVKHAVAVKLRGAELRSKILELLEMFPETNGILVETNQGGDMWFETLHNMPVPVVPVHNSEPKLTRAGRVLSLYQTAPGHVYHVAPLGSLEEQMCAFPQVPNDDLVDAVGNAVLRYLRPAKPKRAGARKRVPR